MDISESWNIWSFSDEIPGETRVIYLTWNSENQKPAWKNCEYLEILVGAEVLSQSYDSCCLQTKWIMPSDEELFMGSSEGKKEKMKTNWNLIFHCHASSKW